MNIGINEMRINLLVRVPQFQKEIVMLRQEFGIPKNGFKDKQEVGNWMKNAQIFEISLDGINIDMTILSGQTQDYSKNPYFKYKFRIKKLVHKFQLPENFEKSIQDYVLLNTITFPKSNWIISETPTGRPNSRKISKDYIHLAVYNRLTKRETKEMIDTLKQHIRNFLPPEVNVPFRVRKQFERDLRILDETLKRTGHPVKKKIYVKEGYLDLLQKRGGITPQNKYQLEKTHRDNLKIGYSQPISKDIAKKEKMKKDAARKAAERMDKLARKLFSVGFS